MALTADQKRHVNRQIQLAADVSNFAHQMLSRIDTNRYAQREKPARVLFAGCSGGGKTSLALHLGSELCKVLPFNGNGQILYIDTESGRGENYKNTDEFDEQNNLDRFSYNYLPWDTRLSNYSIEDLTGLLITMRDRPESCIVIDSISHFWGRAREIVAASSMTDKAFAWGEMETPLRQMFNAICDLGLEKKHVIITGRAKQPLLKEKVNGRTIYKRGEYRLQFRDELKFIFDLVLTLFIEGQGKKTSYICEVDKAAAPFDTFNKQTFVNESGKNSLSRYEFHQQLIKTIVDSCRGIRDDNIDRIKDEKIRSIFKIAKQKNINMSVISREINERGYQKSHQMPLHEVDSLTNWVVGLANGTEKHPRDLIKEAANNPETELTPEVIKLAKKTYTSITQPDELELEADKNDPELVQELEEELAVQDAVSESEVKEDESSLIAAGDSGYIIDVSDEKKHSVDENDEDELDPDF